jgi:ribonuclease HII
MVSVASLSLPRLRQLLALEGGSVPGSILAQMQTDSRKGVRQLAERFVRRGERKRREDRRLDQMLQLESALWNSGIPYVAGVDEAGIGPLAGPVVAAAVIFPRGTRIAGVDDSKRVEPARRAQLAREIAEKAIATSVALAEVWEIDRLNIYQAGLLAMRRAVISLETQPNHLLLDARAVPGLPIPQDGIKKGDQVCFSIAAASILAKTHRDNLMWILDQQYPQYGLASHKGYGTLEHRTAIKQYGPSPIHRQSFPVFQELLGKFSDLFYTLREELAGVNSVSGLDCFQVRFDGVAAELARSERTRLRQKIVQKRNGLRRRSVSPEPMIADTG